MAEKWLVIDAHTHILPQEAIAQAVSEKFDFSTISEKNMDFAINKMRDIEGMLRLMEDAGVDMAAPTQVVYSQISLEVCKALNTGCARVAREYPGKFIFCGHVPLQQGQDVIDEIERCISELGFKGMSLLTCLPGITLDAPELWPIYEKINQLDVPIVIHPPMRSPLGGPENIHSLHSTVLRECDIAKSAIEIMYSVLKDFPDLKFLMPHYGGGMPALKARIRAWFEPVGWEGIPAEIQYTPKTPRELDELGLSKAFDELFDKLYFDMAGSGAGWIPMMKAALAVIRTDRLCFGTDYPFDIHNAQDMSLFINNIKQLDIPESDKRLILGENTKNLFKI